MDFPATQVRRGFGAPARLTLCRHSPVLRPVIPGGGLAPGKVVAVEESTALSLALLAGPLHERDWIGVIGLRGAGLVALAGMGAKLTNLLLVDEPGERWPKVVSAPAEQCRVVLV